MVCLWLLISHRLLFFIIMNNIRKSLFLFLSLFIYSCTSDYQLQEISNDINGEITQMTAILQNWDIEEGYSRTSITTGSYPTAPNPVWVTGDSIGIYPDEGDQLSFRIPQGGSNTCIFDGGGWAMKASSSYTAYSPFNRSYYYKNRKALPISMMGQKQKGNDNSSHLGAYDIQVANGDKPEQGSLTFAFTRKVALVRMELTAPKAANWTTISLESDALFTTDAFLNLSLSSPSLNSNKKSNSVSLALEDVETTSDNLNIIAYMMLLPIDLTGKNLVVKLTDSEGDVYVSAASITNNKTNLSANSARWITANNFKLYEKPDYSWYTSPQSNSYGINTAGQFLAFAKLVNGDAEALKSTNSSGPIDFSGKTILLNKNISLAAYCGNGLGSWNPITDFKGTFDGGGNSISDLYCCHAGNMGLFDAVSNATIKNIIVQGEINRTFEGNESGWVKIGGLVASAGNTLFENCISNVNITTSGSKSTSPIACAIGGICAVASTSTFIACQSSSEISDNHYPIEWGYDIGGIVGRIRSYSNIVACCKLSGDVKELEYGSYSFVGGIVGSSDESSYSNPNNKLYACYTSIDVCGRRPGLIVGVTGDGYRYYDLNAIACYYSGTGTSTIGSGETYGIGNLNYSGSLNSYDSGTARSTNLVTEIQSMNSAITTWNSENQNKCNYKFINGSNGLELVPNN